MTDEQLETPVGVADVVDAIRALTAALAPGPATRPTWDQLRWAPDPEAFGPDQAPAPLEAPDVKGAAAGPLPPPVVANTLIESAWGNKVVTALTNLDTWVSTRFPSRIVGAKVTVNTNASGAGTITIGNAAAGTAGFVGAVVTIDRPTYAFHIGQGRNLIVSSELSTDGSQINLTIYGQLAGGVPAPVGAASFVLHYVAVGPVNP